MMKQFQVMKMRIPHLKMRDMVFVVSMVAIVNGFGNQCGGLNEKWLSAENRVLESFVFKSKKVLNHVMCGRDCSMDKDCKSFNFNKCIKMCELNNGTRAQYPEDLIEDQGSVYFDTDEDTHLFSLADRSFDRYKSCKKLLEAGFHASCIYTIYPDGFNDGLQVYCDMDTDGGGWIVFQRRQDGSENFYRIWNEYKSGFGELSGEFWLGNDNLVSLTSDITQGTWEMRVDLEDWNYETAFAKYNNFQISGDKYTLDVGKYDASSTAGELDSLEIHKGRPFTTKDNDNDLERGRNCAQSNTGAWWFSGCLYAHLNGQYYPNGPSVNYKGIVWYYWRQTTSLKKCSMKMRETE